MTCTTLTHKIGDTFALAGAFDWRDALGVPLDTTGMTAAAQLRTRKGDLIAALVVTLTPGLCTVTQEPGASSSAWPVGPAELDIQFTLPDGAIVSTDTATIALLRDVTRATP